MIIDERTYTMEGQRRFARFSGDYNPMHLDPISARREMFGKVVVHGMNAVLNALDSYIGSLASPEAQGLRLSTLSARFLAPINLGIPVITSLTVTTGSTVKLVSEADGQRVLEVLFTLQPGCFVHNGTAIPSHPASVEPNEPDVLSIADLQGGKGTLDLHFDEALGTELTPHLMRVIGAWPIAELLSLTRLVGMKCPGLRSIFQSFETAFHAQMNTSPDVYLRYDVTKVDRRFGLVTLGFIGPTASGSIQAFLRPEPQRQPSASAVRELVRPVEFAGTVALIIGGSRGLGETVAKIVAAGGGTSIITYRDGKADASRVLEEIRTFGGAGEIVQCDIHSPAAALDQVAVLGLSPSHLYYFATPHIGARKRRGFNRQDLDHYLDVYVDDFAAVCCEVRKRWPGPLSVFYPSTVYVTEVMSQMDEYAAAKAAGETICRYLAARDPKLTIFVERLPRMATDQTLTLIGRPTADALTTLLPLVRRMEAERT